jgi:hypothetical protein
MHLGLTHTGLAPKMDFRLHTCRRRCRRRCHLQRKGIATSSVRRNTPHTMTW